MRGVILFEFWKLISLAGTDRDVCARPRRVVITLSAPIWAVKCKQLFLVLSSVSLKKSLSKRPSSTPISFLIPSWTAMQRCQGERRETEGGKAGMMCALYRACVCRIAFPTHQVASLHCLEPSLPPHGLLIAVHAQERALALFAGIISHGLGRDGSTSPARGCPRRGKQCAAYPSSGIFSPVRKVGREECKKPERTSSASPSVSCGTIPPWEMGVASASISLRNPVSLTAFNPTKRRVSVSSLVSGHGRGIPPEHWMLRIDSCDHQLRLAE